MNEVVPASHSRTSLQQKSNLCIVLNILDLLASTKWVRTWTKLRLSPEMFGTLIMCYLAGRGPQHITHGAIGSAFDCYRCVYCYREVHSSNLCG